MKKGIIVFMLVLAFCLSACSKKAPENPNHQTQAGTAAAPETTGETETVSDPGTVTDTEVGETAPTEFDYEAYLAQSVQLEYNTICRFLSLPLNDGESYAEIKNRLIETDCIEEDQVMEYGGFGWDFSRTDSDSNTIHGFPVNGFIFGFYVMTTPCQNAKMADDIGLSEEKTISLVTKNTYLYKTISGSFSRSREDKLKVLISEIEQFLAEQYPEFDIRFEPDEESPFGKTIYMHPKNGEAIPLSKVYAFTTNYSFRISAPALFDFEEFGYPYGCFANLTDEEISEELIKIISCIPNPGEYLEDYLLRLSQSTGVSWTLEDYKKHGRMQFNYADSWKAGLTSLYYDSLILDGDRLKFSELESLDYGRFNRIGLSANFEDPQRASTVFEDLCEYFEGLYGKEALTLESVDEYSRRHGDDSPSAVRDPEICKVLSYGGGLPMMMLDIDEEGRGVLSVTDWYSKYQKQILDSQLVH